jgi:hypothetical protein
MTSNLRPSRYSKRGLFAVLGVVGILFGVVSPGRAQFHSPTGSWDFVESGARSGIAFITFADDKTLTGYEIIVPKTRTNSVIEQFGFVSISGLWNYDAKGRIIGFWPEFVDQVCQTNITVSGSTNTLGGTNGPNLITNVVCNATTNSVSFVGKVTPGKRFSLVVFASGGKVSFKGVSFAQSTILNGDYYANKIQQKHLFTEFFNLSAVDLGGGLANTYLVAGSGGSYSYTNGIAMLSSQKQLAMVMNTGGDPVSGPASATLRSVIGAYNSKKQTASLKGVDQADGVLTNKITVQISRLPTTP